MQLDLKKYFLYQHKMLVPRFHMFLCVLLSILIQIYRRVVLSGCGINLVDRKLCPQIRIAPI